MTLPGIGIIGAGSMGEILARHLAKLGHQVLMANARGPESLAALATGIGAMAVPMIDAAQADIVILAIPTKAVPTLPPGLFSNRPARAAIIDLGNYPPELRDGRIEAIDRGLLDSGSNPDPLPTAATWTPRPSDAPSPKLIGATSPNTAPNRRLVSGGPCDAAKAGQTTSDGTRPPNLRIAKTRSIYFKIKT